MCRLLMGCSSSELILVAKSNEELPAPRAGGLCKTNRAFVSG